MGYPVEGRGTATSASKEMKELGADEKRKHRNFRYMAYVVPGNKFENWIEESLTLT